jgi:putative endonuclease
VGHCDDLETRLQLHRRGLGARHTAVRLPVDLVFPERWPSTQLAIDRERQLKRWSAEKKAALISGEIAKLKQLAKRRRAKKR